MAEANISYAKVWFLYGNRFQIHGVGMGIQHQIEFLVLASIQDGCRHKHIKLSQKQRCRQGHEFNYK